MRAVHPVGRRSNPNTADEILGRQERRQRRIERLAHAQIGERAVEHRLRIVVVGIMSANDRPIRIATGQFEGNPCVRVRIDGRHQNSQVIVVVQPQVHQHADDRTSAICERHRRFTRHKTAAYIDATIEFACLR